MALQVIGAGFPRTSTASLKAGLERLLGGECYHMFNLLADIEKVPLWQQALDGDLSGVLDLLEGCTAAVDWPVSYFWRELLEQNPDALVLLSVRDSARTWWRSMDATVLASARRATSMSGDDGSFLRMRDQILRGTLGPGWDDAETAMAAYERRNAEIREQCPPERLLEWTATDGYEPICRALDLPVPDEPFPRTNSTAEFVARAGLDAPEPALET